MPLNTNVALPRLKMSYFVKFRSKKDTTCRWPNRKWNKEFVKLSFFFKISLCLIYFALGKAIKRQISLIISAKWRSSFVIGGPDNISVI